MILLRFLAALLLLVIVIPFALLNIALWTIQELWLATVGK